MSQFWYGALSGHSDAEYQGVLTKMTITGHGGVNDVGTYTASYDGDGNMLTQTMPGGLSQVRQYDDSGSEVGLAYHGPVTDEDGEEGTGVWLAWSRAVDASGRVVGENTPDGVWRAGLAGDGAGDYDRSYSYDGAGRLVKVKDITAAPGDLVNTDPDEGAVTPVVERVYGFDKNGNRTGLATRVDGEQVSAREWAYDAADRFTTGGYVFDGLGRQLTIPAVDAPVTGGFAAGSGDITVSYFDDDQARTISRGGVTTTIDLDPAGRRLTLTDSGDGGVVTNHYVDSSDNPGWSTSTIGGDTTLTRYESTIGGDLALTITDGVVSVALSNPNGDVVATLPLNGDDAGAGITSWASFDEYGNLTSTTPANTGVNTYGWHGQSQRALDGSGLILMGVRLYNSATGAFTSRDPIDGGNTTTYAYPQDPINQHDLDGKWRKWAKRVGRTITDSKWGRRIGTACSYAWGGVGAACNVVYASAYAAQGRWGQAALQFVPGGAGKIISRAVYKTLVKA